MRMFRLLPKRPLFTVTLIAAMLVAMLATAALAMGKDSAGGDPPRT